MAYEKKAVFVVASEGYQPVEYDIPKKLLGKAGIKVFTASDKATSATATDGATTNVDFLIKEIPIEDIDGIFIVGGAGALQHLDTEELHTILKNAVLKNKKIGAICIAPRILAAAGILEDKQATGWNGDNALAEIFRNYNVHYKQRDVVLDNNIITATGPDAAREYGEQIISMLE